MYSQKIVSWITRFWPPVAIIIILLVPFHATMTVGLAHLFGHYTAWRLWKEFLMIPLALGALYLLFIKPAIRSKVFSSKLSWLIASFIIVQIIWGIVAYLTHQVSLKALGYSWISDNRYLIFFIIVWIMAMIAPRLKNSWPKVVFWPAVVVVTFGLAQYFVLPYNFMEHLGYSAATIFPYEDINSNIHYIRIMSTLRGADPLGAYLVVIISLILAFWYRHHRWWLVVFAAAAGLALIFSFSRSAWIGLVLSILTIIWASLKSQRLRRAALIGAAICIVVAGGAAFGLRNNHTFQNVVFHTQANSTIKSNSDQGHLTALQDSFSSVLHNPLGRGPGTSGPASVYNKGHAPRTPEDYFLQIGEETGWLGLALFIAITIVIAQALWQRRADTLALGLFASLIGITFINLLSPGWADDTLCYLWWGLAALAYALPLSQKILTKSSAHKSPLKRLVKIFG